jgi:hypothetical protein
MKCNLAFFGSDLKIHPDFKTRESASEVMITKQGTLPDRSA